MMSKVLSQLIIDNAIVTFEIFHSLKKSTSSSYMALKLDMSKTFNRIQWSFLECLIIHMRPPLKFLALIMSCIRIVSYFILINRVPSKLGNFYSKGGIVRVTPSPHIFLICAKGFSSLLWVVEEHGTLYSFG